MLLCQSMMASAMIKSKLFAKKALYDRSPLYITTLKTPYFAKQIDSKYFNFEKFEKEIYTWWEDNGYFKPVIKSKRKSFVIPMPPPNVTGYLHMGYVCEL